LSQGYGDMSRIRVKGFKIFFDRHGKLRCYHRATKIAVDLEKAPLGSAHFFAECARIAALTTAMGAPKPGTLGLLISEYRANAAFTNLEPRTCQDYQRVLDYLKPIDNSALVNFNRALVVRIRDRAVEQHGRRFANYRRMNYAKFLPPRRSTTRSRSAPIPTASLGPRVDSEPRGDRFV
jgi:hypothetical protein